MHDRYAALVKGPSVLFPRGFLWLIPVWYAGIALALEFKGQTPAWYTPAAEGGLALATLTLLCVLATVRNNAFLADETGIWLGLRAGATRRLGRRRRALRQLPWQQIEQIQIRRRSYGARLDVILNETAPITRWPGALRRFTTAVLLLIIPISYLSRTPGLLSPRSDPPSYRIPLYDVTAAELRLALAKLAPAAMPIAEVRRARRQPSYSPPAVMTPPPAVMPPPPAMMTPPPAMMPPPPAVLPPAPAVRAPAPAVMAPHGQAAAAPEPPAADDQQEARGHMIA